MYTKMQLNEAHQFSSTRYDVAGQVIGTIALLLINMLIMFRNRFGSTVLHTLKDINSKRYYKINHKRIKISIIILCLFYDAATNTN